MAKNNGMEHQLSFDFEIPDQKIRFITVRGTCRCGFNYEFKKADVVIEMTALCPECGARISIT